MTDQYEIREDSSNKYWPFEVFNLTEGWNVNDRFATREDAQKRIDEINAPIDMDIFNMLSEAEEAWDNRFSQPLPEPEKPAPEEEAEFVSGISHKVGDEITDDDGNVYVVIQPSYYISPADAADIEDGWDAQVTVGWHTPARLKSQSTEVIIEQVQTGQAEIVRRDGVTCVLFHDEEQIIRLDDLAYNQEMGLYQKSKFPGLQEGNHHD